MRSRAASRPPSGRARFSDHETSRAQHPHTIDRWDDATGEHLAGCTNLPGTSAPEIEVFTAISKKGWQAIAARTGRSYADVADACTQAMILDDHHEWVRFAATKLLLSGDTLWQALCAEWATTCLPAQEATKIKLPIEDALINKSTISLNVSLPHSEQSTGALPG
jgi:hypothetical protein